MARRHPALVPVAREHHECLILAQHLMKDTPASDAPQLAAQAREVVVFFERHLRSHFAIEERIVFPAAREAGMDAADLVSQLVAEHQSMADRVQALATNPQVTPEHLAAFGALLNTHIRREDRILFPLIEARLAPDALLRLQANIEAAYD